MNMKIVIDNKLIDQLLNQPKDKTINNNKYEYVGKGGDGIIYKFNDRVLKIYTKINQDSIMKEFYIVGLLQELDKINKNIVHIDDYYLSLNNPVMVMELLDGNLGDWCDKIIKNPDQLSDEAYDTMWLSMIFQVAYGFMYLNKLKILHNDPKPKNVLYKKQQIDSNNEYTLNKVYKVPTTYVFKIADFGAVQIVGSSHNKMSDQEIYEAIKNRSDLNELSKIILRTLVNYAKKYYTLKDMNKYVNSNEEFKNYAKTLLNAIESDDYMKQLPKNVKNNYILRGLLYYGYENGILDMSEISNKESLKMPSDKVMQILKSLTNPDINIFDMFNIFESIS